jgi:hypothetical protein
MEPWDHHEEYENIPPSYLHPTSASDIRDVQNFDMFDKTLYLTIVVYICPFRQPMDTIKYRKWSENWQNNTFHMIIHCAKQQKRTREGQMIIHPLIVKGKAFRINDRELCVGYQMAETGVLSP